MAKLQLDVVTPVRSIFSGEVEEVRAPGAQGLFGVLPGHSPFLAALIPGELTFRTPNGATHRYAIGGGFAEIAEDKVAVLADTAEAAQEIDLERARRAGEDARRRLRELDETKPEYYAELARLQRSVVRIHVVGGGS